MYVVLHKGRRLTVLKFVISYCVQLMYQE